MVPITMMRKALGVEDGGFGVPIDHGTYRRSVSFGVRTPIGVTDRQICVVAYRFRPSPPVRAQPSLDFAARKDGVILRKLRSRSTSMIRKNPEPRPNWESL